MTALVRFTIWYCRRLAALAVCYILSVSLQVQDRVLSHANEGARTWDALADRRWRIVSVRKRHHTSGQLEYSIGVKGGATVALLWPEGWVGRRATFARNTLWVVRKKEDMREGGWMWPWVSRG